MTCPALAAVFIAPDPECVSGERSWGEPMAEAGARILGERLRSVRRLEGPARRGERDSVHDMRVAVRRLRAVYSLFRRYFAGDDRSGLRAGSRRLGRLLGQVRDTEVLLAGCFAAAVRLPEADLAGFQARMEERRAAGRVGLLDYLDSSAYQDLHSRFERLIERNQRDGRDENALLAS